jgi:DNA-binding NtrC family response regulator
MSYERQQVIILAEDDPSLRELLASALELDGHSVIAVGTGTELIDQVRRVVIHGECGGRVDLVISDVRMPGMDGLLALKILRDAELEVPAILITAFGDRWTKAEAAQHGALLLSKPIELWRLREIVRERLKPMELAARTDA